MSNLSVRSRFSISSWSPAVGAAVLALLCTAACSDDGGASPDAAPPDAEQSATGGIVFVNPNPTAFLPGAAADSFTNVTSMVTANQMTTGVPSNVAAVWPDVVTCLRTMLAPYDVNVVEEDPGDVDHIEIAVSNQPADVGFSTGGFGGLAQTTCEPLPRGIAFAFAGVYGPSVDTNCNNLGWLVGHTVGIDNLFHCPDVNTFLDGCGPKSFTDNDSQCGEFEARNCSCGGTTQNSHQRMLDFYGPAPE